VKHPVYYPVLHEAFNLVLSQMIKWFAPNQWRTQDFFWGGVQQIQLRTEEREDGDLGAVAP